MEVLKEKQRGRNRPWKKALCVLLSLIIAFGTLVTLTVGSSRLQDWLGIQSMLSAYAAEFVETKGAVAVNEETMLADAHVIDLENRDGSNTMYLFSEPISYTDADGHLKTKDISIEKQTDAAMREKGYGYTNGQNDYRIHFAEDAGQGVLVQFDGGTYSIVPQGRQNVQGKESTSAFLQEEFEVFAYENLYGEGTNLKFYPQLNGVKDEIVLDRNIGQDVFSFTLQTENCTAVLNEDGTVSLKSSKDDSVVQTFPAPFAYDSVYVEGDYGAHYSACTYALEETGENTYTLSVQVSADWLNSEDTVYPVVIDPTTSHISNYRDAGIYSSKSSNCYGKEATCCFGRASEYGYGRVLNEFTMPSAIKKGAKINSAYTWQRETTGRTGTTYVTPYIVNASWAEGTVTWATRPGYDTSSGMTKRNINSKSKDDADNPYWYKFNIATAVKKWVDGKKTNNGIIFVSQEEQDKAYNWRAFTAKDYSTSAMRPYTVINYTNDATAPTISSVTGNVANWTRGNVTLTVNGAKDNDGGAGLHATPYSFSTTKGQYSWQASKSKTFTSNCTVYIYVRDALGNIALRSTQKIDKIDKTAPEMPDVGGIPWDWTRENVTLWVSAEDEGSGAAQYSFSATEGTYAWQSENTKTYSGNGTVYVYAKDQAGNISEPAEVEIDCIDKTAPWIEDVSTVQNSETGQTTITVTADDEDSGVWGYSFDGGASWQQEETKTFSAPPGNVSVLVQDWAGNIASQYDVASQPPQIYTDGPYVGLYGSKEMRYKIGEDGDWEEYVCPIAIDHTENVSIYAAYAGKESSSAQKDFAADFSQYVGPYSVTAVDTGVSFNGVQFDLARTYLPGIGWFQSVDTKLTRTNDNILTVTMPDGTARAFEKDKQNGNIYKNILTGYTISVYNDNEETVYALQMDGVVYGYDQNGRLAYIADEEDHRITISRTDSEIRFSYGTGAEARAYVLALSGGKIQSVTTPMGEKIVYSYANGRLTKVQYEESTLQVKREDGIILHEYAYSGGVLTEDNGSVITYDGQGRVTKITAQNGAYTAYTYDGTTVKTASSDDTETETEYDSNLNVLSATDADGDTIDYAYDAFNRVLSAGEDAYTYDAAGNVLTQVTEDSVTKNTYDASGNLLVSAVTTPVEDNAAAAQADANLDIGANGEVTSSVPTQTEYTYYIYADGKISKAFTAKTEVAYASLTGDTLANAFAASDNRTAYTYENGVLKQTAEYVKDADGNITDTTTKYEADNKYAVTEKQTTVEEGKTTQTTTETVYVLDTFGNTVSASGTVQTGEETSAFRTDYTYDALDRQIASDDGTTATATVYDAVGNVLRDSQCTTKDDKTETNVTRTVYDCYGRTLQVIADDYKADEDGLSTKDSYSNEKVGCLYTYDAKTGNLTRERNEQGVETTYTYDNGNKTKEAFDKYVYTYDVQGNIRTITVAGQPYATMEYDKDGNMTAKHYANGQSIRYAYDKDGRLTGQYHDKSEKPYVTYTYNADGELTEKRNTDTMQHTVYAGDKVSIYTVHADGTETFYYSYKNSDTEANGVTTSTYTAEYSGMSVSRSTTGGVSDYTVGENSFTLSRSETDETHSGQQIKSGDTVIGTTDRTYDENGNVIKEVLHYGDQTLELTYTYDDKGRMTRYKQLQFGDEENAQIGNYTYDEKGQLIEEDFMLGHVGYNMKYEYDSRGNLLKISRYEYTNNGGYEQVDVKTFSYKKGNDIWEDELATMSELNESGELFYDENGNPLNYEDMKVGWSAGRQLSAFYITGIDEDTGEEERGNLISYTYDENGIRTEKTIEEEKTTRYTAEDGLITTQEDEDNTLHFIYDENGTPQAFTVNDEFFYYLTNAMGDVIGFTDANGKLINLQLYDVWGTRMTQWIGKYKYDGHSGWLQARRIANLNPLLYRGYYRDAETEFYYLQSRYYSPMLSRFLNADDPEIALKSKTDTAGMNLFAYCNNDPANRVDPAGLKSGVSKADILHKFLSNCLLKGKTITKTSKLVEDYNGLLAADVYYKKSKKNTNKLSVTFGDYSAWKKSTTYLNNLGNYSGLINNYHNMVKGIMTSAGTVSFNGTQLNQAKIITANVALISISIAASVKAVTINSKYKKVWGKKGKDPSNKKGYILFHVTHEVGLNGWYIFKYSNSEWSKL